MQNFIKPVITLLIVLASFISLFAENSSPIVEDLDLISPDSNASVQTNNNISSATPKQTKLPIQIIAQISGGAIWMNYDDLPKEWKLSPWFGYSVSGLVDFSINPMFSVETGLRLSKSGDRYNFEVFLDSNNIFQIPFIDTTLIDSTKKVFGSASHNLYNLSIPVVVMLNVKNFPFQVLAGIDLAYNLYSDGEIEYIDSNIQDEHSKNFSIAILRFNPSLIVGGGVKFNLFSKNIGIRTDTRIGMINVSKEDEWLSMFKTRDVSISFLYYF